MGSLQAQEMRQMLSLDQALRWHLRSNHYPPVPFAMVDVCKKAIAHAAAEEYDEEVALPDGTTYRGAESVPVSVVIDSFHLHDFIEVME